MGPKVAVIGAGVVGTAVAWSLTRRGAQVTIIDKGRPGGGTSSASGAWLNSNDKRPAAYHSLNVGGMRAHAELAARWRSPVWYHPNGNVEWADDVAEAEQLEKKTANLQELGYNVRSITLGELLELEPDLDLTDTKSRYIVYYPEDGWIDAAPLIGALLTSVRGDGAQLRFWATVTGLRTAAGRVTDVELDDGSSVHADVVVNCAGPAAADVSKLLGIDLPMRNTTGLCGYTAPAAISLSRVVHTPKVNVRPDGGGRVWMHSMAADKAVQINADGSYTFDPAAAKLMLSDSIEVYPGLRGVDLEAARVGIRPIPGDGLPAVGPDHEFSNFYTVVTHSGMTLAAHLGDLVSREIVDGAVQDALETFRPQRFAQHRS